MGTGFGSQFFLSYMGSISRWQSFNSNIVCSTTWRLTFHSTSKYINAPKSENLTICETFILHKLVVTKIAALDNITWEHRAITKHWLTNLICCERTCNLYSANLIFIRGCIPLFTHTAMSSSRILATSRPQELKLNGASYWETIKLPENNIYKRVELDACIDSIYSPL